MSLLTEEIFQHFEMRIINRNHIPNFEKRISSIKFSANGEKLISTSNQCTIELYDCDTTNQKVFQLQKYGCGQCDFTTDIGKVIVTSTRRSHSVRELFIEKYEYGTCYNGHNNLVTGLDVHNSEKMFLTGSRDKSILLWDIRIPNSIGAEKDLPDTPLITWHPKGIMFAAGLESNAVCLYDIRGIGRGPMMKFKLNTDAMKWTSLKFSPNGKSMLISTNGTKVRILDSFTGRILRAYGGRRNALNIPIDASFTPGSDYILTGSTDGNLIVYSLNRERSENDKKIAEISSNQNEAITEAELNPKYMMIATASSYVGLWVPKLN